MLEFCFSQVIPVYLVYLLYYPVLIQCILDSRGGLLVYCSVLFLIYLNLVFWHSHYQDCYKKVLSFFPLDSSL